MKKKSEELTNIEKLKHFYPDPIPIANEFIEMVMSAANGKIEFLDTESDLLEFIKSSVPSSSKKES